jgi:CheB methylesterase
MIRRDVIAIGGSSGAVDAIKKLCHDLPADFAASMFIVVHIGSAGSSGRPAAAGSYEERVNESRSYADILRRAINEL